MPAMQGALERYLSAKIYGHHDAKFLPGRILSVTDKDGRVAAAWCYHNWDDRAGVIEVTAAAEKVPWMSRGVLQELFAYPFEFCQMVITRQVQGSPQHRQWVRFGATEHIIPRLFGRDYNGAVCTLTKEQWAAHPMNRGQHGR